MEEFKMPELNEGGFEVLKTPDIIGGKTHIDNYSTTSLLGTVVFIILVFFLRNYFITFVQL
jgi:hypothetical protein